MLLQWGRVWDTSTLYPPSPPVLTLPTPTQPAWLAQHSLRSRRFRAVVTQFPPLLIPNGIILFLGDKCFHWPLCLLWHVRVLH